MKQAATEVLFDECRPMDYIRGMEFEWDDAKNNVCFMRRDFDFTYAALVFLDLRLIVLRDHRRDYGENRYQLLGMIGRLVHVIIYTMRDSAASASFRPARPTERRL